MHFSHGDIFEAEGAAARLFGYVESGSFHYLVRNYEGGDDDGGGEVTLVTPE